MYESTKNQISNWKLDGIDDMINDYTICNYHAFHLVNYFIIPYPTKFIFHLVIQKIFGIIFILIYHVGIIIVKSNQKY